MKIIAFAFLCKLYFIKHFQIFFSNLSHPPYHQTKVYPGLIIRNVVNIIPHPSYDKKTHLADIALLRVDKEYFNTYTKILNNTASDLSQDLDKTFFISTYWNFKEQIFYTYRTPYYSSIQYMCYGLDQCPPPTDPM